MGELSEVRDQIDRRRELVRRLGARRFDADALLDLARTLLAEGQRPGAGTLLREALAISVRRVLAKPGRRLMALWP
jgi:hypothetical protein